MTRNHLLLVDASGFAFRSYYSFPPFYRASDGQPVGAVLGFMQITWNMLGAIKHDPATHAAAVFDPPPHVRTFRKKLDPAYKANRDPARRVELDKQFAYMRIAAEAMGMKAVGTNDEADDVIATLATMAAVAGWRVTIVSSDKDYGQLVQDGVIEIVDPMARVHGKPRARILEADIRQKWGVAPDQVQHVQALCGDAVDGIRGARTCGPDKAAQIIRRWAHLEGALKHADEIPWPGVRVEIKRAEERLRRNLKLTTLKRNVRLKHKLDDLVLEQILKSSLLKMLIKLEQPKMMAALFGGMDSQDLRLEPRTDGKTNYDWWEAELAAPGRPGRLPDVPQCGFYMRKLVYGAAFVAGRIWREPFLDDANQETDMDMLRCEVAGKMRDPYQEWPRLSMHPITAADYNFMVARADHAKRWDQQSPYATPEKPIDITKSAISVNPRSKQA